MSVETPSVIRVMCVDDHPLVRKGIAFILANEPDLQLVGATLNDALLSLSEQIRRGLQFAPGRDAESDVQLRAEAVVATRAFAHELPEIRNVLVTDLAAAFAGDPAATSVSEILLCYRGVNAIIHHRLAHALYRLGPVIHRGY